MDHYVTPACPACQSEMSSVRYNCGDGSKSGGCMVVHSGYRCLTCEKVWHYDRVLVEHDRAVNVVQSQIIIPDKYNADCESKEA